MRAMRSIGDGIPHRTLQQGTGRARGGPNLNKSILRHDGPSKNASMRNRTTRAGNISATANLFGGSHQLDCCSLAAFASSESAAAVCASAAQPSMCSWSGAGFHILCTSLSTGTMFSGKMLRSGRLAPLASIERDTRSEGMHGWGELISAYIQAHWSLSSGGEGCDCDCSRLLLFMPVHAGHRHYVLNYSHAGVID